MAAISVVIPTYNRARLLGEAIESALAQTRPPDEIVVVDDGSTDATPEVLARFASRVRAVRQDNAGEAAARNRGVAEARGEWIAFLDSDDLWEPDALERLEAASHTHPDAGLIAMRARALREDGTRTTRVHGKKSPGPFFTTRSLLVGDAGGVLMPLVRRDLLLAAGGFDTAITSATDCDMWLRLSFKTTMIGVPDPLLLVRVHPDNASADKTLNARMWIRILAKLEREHPAWVRENPWAFRRAVGKEHLRLGREALASWDGSGRGLAEARAALATSVRTFPFFARAWSYLAWSWIAPRRYGAWRKAERGWKS